ncbi:unnamed protein product [Cylindrotheca closterium]|uniref:Uncharacterized protein n=1 Tax=Cylindrotheca closterium TaxID=2856 RepID=A0AAD2G9P3_9STRA|nr:unnamed protein product [Cylindrotheca closterium]
MPSLLYRETSSDEDQYDGQTILSSHASGAYIPPPEASQEQWAISPHPGLVADSIFSMSTGCTDSISYRHIEEARASRDISSKPAASRDGNVAAYSKNGTEHLLSIVEPPRKLLPVPPAPLKAAYSDVSDCDYEAEDYLPGNFVCKLCSDVIVGALSLNCGCASSTVCSLCWETRDPETFKSKEAVDKLGYVIVQDGKRSLPSCPSCTDKIESKINCHALDVAIFQIVLNLPGIDDKVRSLKNAYFSRLEGWRNIVIERNENIKRQEEMLRDELLARLLQEEEELFYGGQQVQEKAVAREQYNGLLFWSQAALAVVVATLASIGLKAVARR